MNDDDPGTRNPIADAHNAERLRTRIAAILRRATSVVPVHRADGTIFLRGRRRLDRSPDAADRRSGERRQG